MFGSRWRLSASSLSKIILWIALTYSIFVGIICFRVKHNRIDGRLVAQNINWYKWFCLVSRLLMASYYVISYRSFIYALSNEHLRLIFVCRLVLCLICAIVTVVLQFWYGKQVLRVVNSFLRLFWRVKALPGCQHLGYGGKLVLSLLILKVLCLVYELCFEVPELIEEFSLSYAMIVLCESYNTVNASMVMHVCFVGYLSIGILYDQVNTYVRNELRQQLKGLRESPDGLVSRRQFKDASMHVDECLAIYDEIHQVGCAFHRLFELPLCLLLIFELLSLALVAFFILFNLNGAISFWISGIKVLLDVLLLTMAVHGACSSSRIVRRLSLENYYVGENKEWHMKMEMFLGRLNYHEFRVRPLGMFEVSNELILVFLSGLVTYLTYMLQYGMQWDKL